MHDCIIVGAGPAGLNAAIILGRCRRRVLLCDNEQPRNQAAQSIHGFLTRDGIPPQELRCLGREELRAYPSVEFCLATATKARQLSGRFDVVLGETGEVVIARKLLLASGVVDKLPEVKGLLDFYGKSVFHCPYCDGWEHRDQPTAVYGNGRGVVGLSLNVSNWTNDLVLCTDGRPKISRRDQQLLASRGIAVRPEHVERLEGTPDGQIERIVFTDGSTLDRTAMFINTVQSQRSPLAEQLGCQIKPKKCSIDPTTLESTIVSGLYVAGDATRDVQMVIVAAAEGARAAFSIHKALLKEDVLTSIRPR
jgi:thioredoxin reductase